MLAATAPTITLGKNRRCAGIKSKQKNTFENGLHIVLLEILLIINLELRETGYDYFSVGTLIYTHPV